MRIPIEPSLTIRVSKMSLWRRDFLCKANDTVHEIVCNSISNERNKALSKAFREATQTPATISMSKCFDIFNSPTYLLVLWTAYQLCEHRTCSHVLIQNPFHFPIKIGVYLNFSQKPKELKWKTCEFFPTNNEPRAKSKPYLL